MSLQDTARADIDKDILETPRRLFDGAATDTRIGIRERPIKEIARALQAERDKSKWQDISTGAYDASKD